MHDRPGITSILQFIDDCVILLSETGHIVYINQAALSFFSLKQHDVVEQSFSQLLDQNNLPSPLPKTLTFPYDASFSAENIEIDCATTKKIVSWALTPHPLDSEHQGLLLIGKDITAARKAEEKIGA